jgi:hypothetical protein
MMQTRMCCATNVENIYFLTCTGNFVLSDWLAEDGKHFF